MGIENQEILQSKKIDVVYHIKKIKEQTLLDFKRLLYTPHIKIWDVAKTVIIGKCIALNELIKGNECQ